MYDVRTRASKESLRVLRERYKAHLWHNLIPIDTRFRDASRAGVPPAFYDPRSRGVAAYTRLLQHLQQNHPNHQSRLAV
jgi:chromosome partitioning protein